MAGFVIAQKFSQTIKDLIIKDIVRQKTDVQANFVKAGPLKKLLDCLIMFISVVPEIILAAMF